MKSLWLALAVCLALGLAALFACAAEEDDIDDKDLLAYAFPDGFLFGAATAGYQVDMGCPTLPDDICVDDRSDWYEFVTSSAMQAEPSNHLSGEDPGEIGPGHWELFEHDFDLVANELSHNAFRMSIEWSRIFPESTVGVEGYESLRAIADPDALAHYHDVFEAMAARGITPYVTLHHYTLPVWIHDGIACHEDLKNCSPRGWLEPEVIVPEIAKYAGFVAEEFGQYVDWWGTQNEPFAVMLPGYLLQTPERINPPAVTLKFEEAKASILAMVEAHARMYDAVKIADRADADSDGVDAWVGIVYAFAPVRPIDPNNPLDVAAAENIFYLWNLVFMDAVALGRVDRDLTGDYVVRPDLVGRMDYVGINYKVRLAVEGLSSSLLPRFSPLLTLNPFSLVMDEVYPRGTYEMAMLVKDRYDLPVVITENNGQDDLSDGIENEIRTLVESFSWLSLAIADGADVRGYFYWSLMDNVEWNQGTGKPLGLYEVNSDDPEKRRIPRATVPVFARVAGAGGVPPDMAARYPIEAADR